MITRFAITSALEILAVIVLLVLWRRERENLAQLKQDTARAAKRALRKMLNRPNYGGKIEIIPVAIVHHDGTEEEIQ